MCYSICTFSSSLKILLYCEVLTPLGHDGLKMCTFSLETTYGYGIKEVLHFPNGGSFAFDLFRISSEKNRFDWLESIIKLCGSK